ncbi:hypothetical protein J2Z48_002904 [Croceifilum oryzae]|uniref:Uncharacterized protein n=1 Tax=Croceifilum oryzae TaxID=1553429 RepID=A0AAJ1TMM1_9BACL|nr:hypothetical protein [Croceifilum oryzae]MDQ0418701.1 hypothetical protein [Croceifilum oryzae]
MELMIGVLLFMFIMVTIIVNVVVRNNKKRGKNIGLHVLPDLGLQKNEEPFQAEMKKLVEHIEQSIPEHYASQVRERVIREYQISQHDFQNRWFEWKRYLAMVSILPYVPMYSRDVDVIWHEMLMFTKDYEQFSKKLLGTTLHHQPHGPEEQKLVPNDRAWFDLIFHLLFAPTKYTNYTWGKFLKHPVSVQVIHDFRTLSTEKLQERYFNTDTATHFPVIENIQKLLITQVKQKLEKLDQFYVTHGSNVRTFKKYHNMKSPDYIFMGFLFLSAYHYDAFLAQYALLNAQSSSYSSNYVFGTGDSDSGSSDSGGSDSGSSDSGSSDSGSSGGSSCGGSSGCGGGGCGGGS